MQQRHRDDLPIALGDQTGALRDPWVQDGLIGLALELRKHSVDREHDPRDHSGDVQVHERSQVISIAALKLADGNGHRRNPFH